jgi:hypothetical protein
MAHWTGRMTLNEIAESAKNAGVVLTALSGAGYACGYLVVRARARALGTEPGFALVDQAYVFAGFRFVLALLFALLVTVLPLLLLREIGRFAGMLAPGLLLGLEILTALSVGAATIAAYVATFGVSGVLLSPSSGWLTRAVLEQNNYGTLLFLATTLLGGATLLWAYAHSTRAGGLDTLGMVLLLIGALLLVLLPLQHGAFNADRLARQLERAPNGVTGIALPIWLVDRGAADRVVVYGHAADGKGRLMTLKADALDGIPVVGVSSLGTAVGESRP